MTIFFTTELMAIKLSLLWIVENGNNIEQRKNISLFSDSLSELKAIKTGKTDGRPNMLNDIYELVNIVDQNVTLLWIPSHQGIKWNETADQGAQQATKKAILWFGRKPGTEGDESRNYAMHSPTWKMAEYMDLQHTWTILL